MNIKASGQFYENRQAIYIYNNTSNKIFPAHYTNR